MKDPLSEGYTDVVGCVLEKHRETAAVEPYPGDLPAIGSGELDYVPEASRIDSHRNGVGYDESHFHLFLQFDTTLIDD